MLLVAFALNLARKLSERHPVYLLLNLIGSLLAAVYALDGGAIPFVILEAVWGGFALVKLVTVYRKPAL
jgi:hypothetical protein